MTPVYTTVLGYIFSKETTLKVNHENGSKFSSVVPCILAFIAIIILE
jgi:hypothetical protein